MPKLYGEIEAQKSAAATIEKRRVEEEKLEREKAEQQEKFDRRAEALIRAFQEKKIDQEKLQSSVRELNAEIAIFKGEAVAESDATSPPATQEETTHDEAERGEDEVDEESVEPSTQSGKAVTNLMPKRKERSNSVIYVEVVGPVSDIIRSSSLNNRFLCQCDRCKTFKKRPECVVISSEPKCRKCEHDRHRCTWNGANREILQGEIPIRSKRSKGDLSQKSKVDESSDEDVTYIGTSRSEST
jgi:hypothetical protein